MSSVPAVLLLLVPESLRPVVENHWIDWVASCEAKKLHPQATLRLQQLGKVWACSDFVARTCVRYPAIIFALLTEGFATPRSLADYTSSVEKIVSMSKDEAQLMKALRVFRQQEMVRIAWRDLNSLDSLDVIFQELTDLAEAMVSVVLQALEKQQAEIYGMPRDAEGKEQALLVFAMGKMGGGELNFSSDIDLIFSYPDDGETTGSRQTSHYEFYLAVIRKLVKVLDEVTADGFVYRVDTRLRPFGESGPMAMSFSGLEQYYQLHGRDWERYAMIKAKLITGRDGDRESFQSMLTPFVYRRYLDFSMIESIREMKSMINAQMKRKSMTNNIKLGRGGIREIEFIGQTFQLIRAGRDPELRQRSIVNVLTLLAEKNHLTDAEASGLQAAYWFLRKLENRLQILSDKQTHTLPDDEQSQQRICVAMGLADWQTLNKQLSEHQQVVDKVFQNLITTEVDEPDKAMSTFVMYWLDAEKTFVVDGEAYTVLQKHLTQLGYEQVDKIISSLAELRSSFAIRRLSDNSARLMAQLVGSIVEKITTFPRQLELLDRVCRILKAVAGRKVYISLLKEFPAIQQQMLEVCSSSEWFT
ncbi:MAG: bifunctional [glutamate--ammonia ligase]-adenylyl-L-tyrosine phosphorylase/[glutamate--ammonia-ligase] adenylyltransferase, partial [Gammaproteobacteria bacterium]|nr:bifunctional [glutamate--ammonia ligase]-adenylyl-L-tyrosine phosphorylase/[glutamate--ammonia-ligase] adenylyltransferase [Gammaproteobacteria bacterium]